MGNKSGEAVCADERPQDYKQQIITLLDRLSQEQIYILYRTVERMLF